MPKHSLVGKKAPEFSLPNFDGQTFTFTPGATGRPTALFFYPQSGTYGCTKEVCQFRDALADEEVFKSTHVEVIGVSPDPVEKQKAFAEKQGVTYPILSDAKGEARKAYSVTKGLMGLTASSRVTFVIDADGTVKDVLDSTINYAAHHKFVQNWLKTQTAASKVAVAEPSTSTSTATAPAPAPAAEPQFTSSAPPDPVAKPEAANPEPAATPSAEPERKDPAMAPALASLDPAAAAPAVPVPAAQTVA